MIETVLSSKQEATRRLLRRRSASVPFRTSGLTTHTLYREGGAPGQAERSISTG